MSQKHGFSRSCCQPRADDLAAGAKRFESTAEKLKSQMRAEAAKKQLVEIACGLAMGIHTLLVGAPVKDVIYMAAIGFAIDMSPKVAPVAAAAVSYTATGIGSLILGATHGQAADLGAAAAVSAATVLAIASNIASGAVFVGYGLDTVRIIVNAGIAAYVGERG